MSENIPYIIAEDGYYYVAYREKAPVPEIVVSSKGIANGLSEEYNDGWDFGPDSYSPTSTSAIPYTQTSGIQEALNYTMNILINNYFTMPQFNPSYHYGYGAPTILLGAGIFKISEPIAYPAIIEDKNGNAQYLGINFIGAGQRNTILEDITTNGLSAILSGGTSNGNYIANQEYGQQSPALIGGFTLKSNDMSSTNPTPTTATKYGMDFNVGDTPPHWKISQIEAFGNFQNYGIDIVIDDSIVEDISLSSTNSSNIIANIQSSGGLLHVNRVYASGYGYGNISVGGSQLWLSNSILNSITIPGCGELYLDNIWTGNNFPYTAFNGLINIMGNVGKLSITKSHLKGFATSTTAADSPALFYLGSGGALNSLTCENNYFAAYQSVSGAVSLLSKNSSNNEWLNSVDYVSFKHPYGFGNISSSQFKLTTYSAIGIPTLPANPPVSGTAYQNTNPYDIIIDLPVYAPTSGTAGTVAYGISATSTVTEMAPKFVSGSTSSSAVDIVSLRVPAGWYFEFTASGVDFGTAVVQAV